MGIGTRTNSFKWVSIGHSDADGNGNPIISFTWQLCRCGAIFIFNFLKAPQHEISEKHAIGIPLYVTIIQVQDWHPVMVLRNAVRKAPWDVRNIF